MTSLGTAKTVNVSFQWGTTPGVYPNETTAQAMTAPGPFSFDLTGLTAGTTYYFRAKADGGIYGTSYGLEKSFTTAPSLTITTTSPNGGEVWPAGSTQTITWTSAGIPTTSLVRIELSRDGGRTWTPIIPSTPNDGSQPWRVTGPPTTTARIRITSLLYPAIFDISDANFTITRPPLPTAAIDRQLPNPIVNRLTYTTTLTRISP